MHRIHLLIISICLLTACNQRKTNNTATDSPASFEIEGTVSDLDTGKILAFQLDASELKTDTIHPDANGHFTITGKTSEPVIGTLYFLGEAGNQIQPLSFFVEPGKINIGTTTSSELYKVSVNTNGKANTEMNEIKKVIAQYTAKMEALQDSFKLAYQTGRQNAFSEIQHKALMISQQMRTAVFEYAQKHANSHAAAYYVYRFLSPEINGAEVATVYDHFSDEIKKSIYAKRISEVLDVSKKTAIGSMAPDFELATPDGKKVHLSDYKGTYVLLDFWASWCGPCRQENPNVVKAYETFKQKGFTILGVSLDEDVDRWKQAIKSDRLTWTHVSDLKGWQSETAALYGVQAIPGNFLINKEGIIVAKNLRGETLHEKLQEVLK